MYTLKLQKITKENCIYATYYTSYLKLSFLGEFLEDFNFPDEATKRFFNNFFEDQSDNCIVGNTSCIEKKNNNFHISSIYNDDESEYLEIPQESLKELIKLYADVLIKCPKEIIITLDELMQNPTVEIVKCDCLVHRDL